MPRRGGVVAASALLLAVVFLVFVDAVTAVRDRQATQEEEGQVLRLRALVAGLLDQNARLAAAADELRAGLSQVRTQQADCVGAAASRRLDRAQWQRKTTAKLHALVEGGGRRRASVAGAADATAAAAVAAQAQKRDLSSAGTCAESPGARLLVGGACSCTGGLLVQGRNLTQELDALVMSAAATVAATTTGTAAVTTTTTAPTTSPPSMVCASAECQDTLIQDFPGTIFCSGASACTGTTFKNVSKVICGSASYVCQSATFEDVDVIDCTGAGYFQCNGISVADASSVICVGASVCGYSEFTDVALLNCTGTSTSSSHLCSSMDLSGAGQVICAGSGIHTCYNSDIVNAAAVELSNIGSLIRLYKSNGDYSGVVCTAPMCGVNYANGPRCGTSEPCTPSGYTVTIGPTRNDTTGVVSCVGSYACKYQVIEDHHGVVVCDGYQACVGTAFKNVSKVICGSASYACGGATFDDVDVIDCTGAGYFQCNGISVADASSVICVGASVCGYSEFTDVALLNCTGTSTSSSHLCSSMDLSGAGQVICAGSGIHTCYNSDIVNAAAVELSNIGSLIRLYNSNGDYSGLVCTASLCDLNYPSGPRCGATASCAA